MNNDSVSEYESLIQDYLSDSLSAGDMRKLSALLQSDASCREALREAIRAYGIASTPLFEQRRKQNLHSLQKQLGMRAARKPATPVRIKFWRYAAACALFIGIVWIFLYRFRDIPSTKTLPPPSYCHIKVPVNSRTELLLPDSTIVCLNGGTELTYDTHFAVYNERNVTLKGEAYFKVRKNAEKPFIVRTDGLYVKVLGTTFNVSSYADRPDISVSLVEGSVQVFPEANANNTVVLAPDEQAVYNKASHSMTIRQVNADSHTVWATQRLNFTNEALSHILKAIEKEYGVKIHCRTDQVDKEFFTGSIDLTMPLDVVLSYLDVDHKFRWKRNHDTITVYDR
ncbi:FecR family protein [Bacteroides heparinolyticus]|uniref:FecR family protein n=4 Tax=Prevotella heparinolytica TaxID=28113 RepID=UPI0023F8F8CC|nr:FecR family protein [Bacteroides heparinolyticus]MCI6212889.1 FecR domain-containing protein [Bacteroides heparinolyticus]